MNMNSQQTQQIRIEFEQMYTDGGLRDLSALALDKHTKMGSGVMHRRELGKLRSEETTRRKILQDFIALEDPHLWTLFEASPLAAV